MSEKKDEFCLKRERAIQEKITRLENAVRSPGCLAMHKRFLCSSSYIMSYFFDYMFRNILKFKDNKLFENNDADLTLGFSLA